MTTVTIGFLKKFETEVPVTASEYSEEFFEIIDEILGEIEQIVNEQWLH